MVTAVPPRFYSEQNPTSELTHQLISTSGNWIRLSVQHRSLLLCPFRLADQSLQQHVHERQQNGANKGRAERPDKESRHYCRGDLQDDRVDHEPEESKREDREWEREDLEHESERGVEEAKDQCAD
jgi:hypothetical protein